MDFRRFITRQVPDPRELKARGVELVVVTYLASILFPPQS